MDKKTNLAINSHNIVKIPPEDGQGLRIKLDGSFNNTTTYSIRSPNTAAAFQQHGAADSQEEDDDTSDEEENDSRTEDEETSSDDDDKSVRERTHF